MDLCLPLCFFYVCVCCFCIKNGKVNLLVLLFVLSLHLIINNFNNHILNLKDNDETNYNNRMCNHADG